MELPSYIQAILWFFGLSVLSVAVWVAPFLNSRELTDTDRVCAEIDRQLDAEGK